MLKHLIGKNLSGTGRVVKYGAILDKSLFDYCESHTREILDGDAGS